MCVVPMYYGDGGYVGCGNEVGLFDSPLFWCVLFIALIWTMFWKGVALWHAAKRKEGFWFIVLLVVNSLGILDVIYLFFIAKVKGKNLFK